MGLLPGKLEAPALFGVALLGALSLPAPFVPSASAAPAPWLPPPTNVCGEVGFDPLARQPDPSLPPPPAIDIPPVIDIWVPVPEITPVTVPDPPQDNTRIVAEPLPTDPCRNPCPDVRDTPKPVEESHESESTAPDTGSGSGSNSGSASGSGSGSAALELPRIELRPEIEPIPIPVPGGEGDTPQPAPPHVVHPVEPGPVARPLGTPRLGAVDMIGQVTGHGSINRTDMRWQVDGTDLGLMWETEPGKIAMAFGDTFGDGWQYGRFGGPDWRSNVLGFSTDRDLSDGLVIDTMVQDSRCHAAEFLSSRKIKNWETTVIPTSGFAIGKRQYLSYMSINHWSRTPGMWSTNFGGIAYSDDGGSTWTKDQHARWDNIFGFGRFQVAAMVPHGEHVYMFGTPNGRLGVTGLARVDKDEVLNKSAYQYWVDGSWAPAAENQATPLFRGIASELSVRYDATADRWQMMYLDPLKASIVLRQAATPQGVWSDSVPVASTLDYPKAYGGFIHPWSTDTDLYFTVSAWDSYNVYLMRAKLDSPR
ncbi:DUF4185 domain-containing protein [Nocardia noduli]|uniref:DUF4185 domain-containing protein n=1 Tax=Nocardia noduli TaxID=2815722 RepID=UPI001C21254E|nr:DUF4185 domain-containing protein [Nocardia noduli]